MARRDLTGAVDFAYLEDYAAGDLGLVEEVLGLFEQQTQMWTRLMEGEGEAYRDGAHALKGASAGIGARALAEACGAAELQAGADPEVRRRRLDAVLTRLGEVEADIAAWRHEQALRGLKS